MARTLSGSFYIIDKVVRKTFVDFFLPPVGDESRERVEFAELSAIQGKGKKPKKNQWGQWVRKKKEEEKGGVKIAYNYISIEVLGAC